MGSPRGRQRTAAAKAENPLAAKLFQNVVKILGDDDAIGTAWVGLTDADRESITAKMTKLFAREIGKAYLAAT